jgi:hypothetical protein
MQLKFDRKSLNKSLQALAEYMMKQKLFEQEQEGRMTAIGAEQTGRMEYQTAQERAAQALEKTEHTNRMTQINEQLQGELLRMPTIAGMRAQAELAKKKGDLVAAKKYDDDSIVEAGNLGRQAYLSQFGERATEEELTRAARTSQTAMTDFLQEGGAERRSMRAAGVEGAGQQIRREELAQKGTETNTAEFRKDQKIWLDIVGDKISGLQSQGVTSSGGSLNAISAFFSQKSFNPMSPEDLGKALEGLTQLQTKIARGYLPTGEEQAFVNKIVNVAQVKKEGGLPSAETGRWPSEQKGLEKRITDAQELEFVRNAMTNYGIVEATARQLYKEFFKEKARAIQRSRTPAAAAPIK